MTGKTDLLRADKGQPAIALQVVDQNGFEAWMKAQPERLRQSALAQGFAGEGFQLAILPGEASSWSAVLGVADSTELGTWCLAKAAELLPEGTYRLAGANGSAALGWVLGQYRFDRYKQEPSRKGPRILLTDDPARIEEALLLAEATNLVRDLVNLPTSDLGPAELSDAAKAVADSCKAQFTCISGKKLEEGFPMIAAVGRGADPTRAPLLVEMQWGDRRHPKVAVIGKGVCFDTGGLDIKPSSAMRLMKKDMGGAAHALALAQLIMKSRLPVRMHLLIPAVENSVSATAFRPGDVLKTRNGITVEVDNTDAEGRLVLADAITRAGEEEPELIIDFATLTGAARVALGPDLPALFSNNDDLADELAESSRKVGDPLWRLPLWPQYAEMLNSDVADIANASDTPMAGAVTAALFLEKFVPPDTPWAHLDTFAWRSSPKPGRPKGGDALGLRAVWQTLNQRYGG